MSKKYSTKETRLGRNEFKVERIKKSTMDDKNLLKPGEEEGEGYKGTPDMYPDYDIDFEEDFKKIDAGKMVGGGIARPEQPIKGVKPIQVKGRKFQGIF